MLHFHPRAHSLLISMYSSINILKNCVLIVTEWSSIHVTWISNLPVQRTVASFCKGHYWEIINHTNSLNKFYMLIYTDILDILQLCSSDLFPRPHFPKYIARWHQQCFNTSLLPLIVCLVQNQVLTTIIIK